MDKPESMDFLDSLPMLEVVRALSLSPDDPLKEIRSTAAKKLYIAATQSGVEGGRELFEARVEKLKRDVESFNRSQQKG